MSFTDWHSGHSLSTPRQQKGYIMSTTVDELSYTPSEQEKSRDAAQIEATGRRSWKTIRGKGEAVWPPNLEAALIEALERYHPEATGSRSNKYAGRFPMRNKFISDYIFETTGKRRTPKQVGSRLQQLRDTCKEDRILHLISHHAAAGLNSGSSHSEGSVCTSTSPSPGIRELGPRSIDHHVDISLPKELWPAPTPAIHLISNDRENPQRIQLSPSACVPQGQQSAKSSMSSLLRSLSRSVEFLSQCALAPQSTFHVYVEGSNLPIHSEVAPLRCISSPMQRSGWLYSSDLVPVFWDNLISTPDLNQYTILQILKPMSSGEPVGPGTHDNTRRTNSTISVFYKFKIPELPRRSEPVSRAAQSTGYSSSNQSVPAPRQTASSLSYCQWQPGILDGDPSNYQLISNIRGDVSSTLLGPTNTMPQASTSYTNHQSSSNYMPMQTGSTKYEAVDHYEEYSNSTYFTPPDDGWTDQLPAQSFHASQPWTSNYY